VLGLSLSKTCEAFEDLTKMGTCDLSVYDIHNHKNEREKNSLEKENEILRIEQQILEQQNLENDRKVLEAQKQLILQYEREHLEHVKEKLELDEQIMEYKKKTQGHFPEESSSKLELEKKIKDIQNLKKEVEHKNSLLSTRNAEIETLKKRAKKLEGRVRTLEEKVKSTKAETYDSLAISLRGSENFEKKTISQKTELQRQGTKIAALELKILEVGKLLEDKSALVIQFQKNLKKKEKFIAKLEVQLSKANSTSSEKFLPLIIIGVQIRSRFFEKMKAYRSQDRKLVEIGDDAAYAGAAAADALLFSPNLALLSDSIPVREDFTALSSCTDVKRITSSRIALRSSMIF
jgi:myosin heavy subunit